MKRTILSGLMFTWLCQAIGAVSYTTPGSTYLQNFDTLPNTPENVSLGLTANGLGWTDDNASPSAGQYSIAGWYLYHPTVPTNDEGGVNGHQRLRIGAGTANTGTFMSFGSSGSTDRALGNIGANTLTSVGSDLYIGLRLRNETGQALHSFTLTYDGEQWRDGGAATPNAQTMNFMWSTTATAISDPNSSFTLASALDFTGPVFVNTGSGVAVDGNTAGRVAGITATVSGLNWLPDTDLWLRWGDINHSGNDHGLAIDNLSFIAVIPEPSGLVLLGFGITGLLLSRRVRA